MFKNFIIKNWFFILIGLWLEIKAFEMAYAFRGYIAIGSEVFVLPFFLFVVNSIRSIFIQLGKEKRKNV